MGNQSSTNFKKCENLNMENIADTNDIVECVKTLKGQASNSSSDSDVYLLDFKDDSFYNGSPLRKGFQKVFISKIKKQLITGNDKDKEFVELPYKIPKRSSIVLKPDPVYPGARIAVPVPHKDIDFTPSHILLYEYYIYKLKIAPLVYYNISPHFIKFLGGVTDTNSENLILYLQDKIPGSNLDQITENFKRNLVCILAKDFEEGRLSITDNVRELEFYNELTGMYEMVDVNKDIKFNNNIFNPLNYHFGFILNEAVEIPSVGTDRNLGQSITFERYLSEIQIDSSLKLGLYNLLFQIAQGCYSMELSGINHNDLHDGNIWIKLIKPDVSSYYINDKKFQIKCENQALIYDFDRAYIQDFLNSYLHQGTMLQYNQANRIRPSLDFVKSCTYVMITLNRIINDEYSTINAPFSSAIEIIESAKKVKICEEIRDDIFFILLKDSSKRGQWSKRLLNRFLSGEVAFNEFKLISSYDSILQKIYQKILSVRPEKEYSKTDHTYILDEKMFQNYYIDHLKYEKVLSNLIADQSESYCKPKLDELQNRLNLLQDQYNDLLVQKNQLEARLSP